MPNGQMGQPHACCLPISPFACVEADIVDAFWPLQVVKEQCRGLQWPWEIICLVIFVY